MTGFPASCADFHKTLCFNVFGSLLVMCICRNFLSVGVSVREGYWRIKLSLPSLLIASVTFLLSAFLPMQLCLIFCHYWMMVYVVVQLVEEFETDATKPDSLAIATNRELLLV